MGRLKSNSPSHGIVVHEWQDDAQAAPRFWMLSYAQSETSYGYPTAAPVDVVLPSNASEASSNNLQLPSLLIFVENSQSILAYRLSGGEQINANVNRWGPGLRLTQTQTMKQVFATEGKSRLEAATLVQNRDFSGGEEILTVVATMDASGIPIIKHRLSRFSTGRASSDEGHLLDIHRGFRYAEHDLRTLGSHNMCADGSLSLHSLLFGSSPHYLGLLTVRYNTDKNENILSLNTLESSYAFAEAHRSAAEQDLGLVWHVQQFEIPGHISRIAPVTVQATIDKYLLIFYCSDGFLWFARAEYAGSGHFTDFVHGYKCIVGEAKEPRPRPKKILSSAPTRSRFSFLSYKSTMSTDSLSSQSVDFDNPDGGEKGLPVQQPTLTGERSIPYATKANGYVWIFFEDIEGKGRYYRHEQSRNIEDYDHGWETKSWELGPSEAGAARHLIPTSVPANFMNMK